MFAGQPRLQPLNTFLCVVYRQPNDQAHGNRSTAEEFNKLLEQLTHEISSLPTPTPSILIAGDFNLPHTMWPAGLPTSGAGPDERRMLELLSDFCSQHFLTQIVQHPTHRAGNTLDLMLTNNPDYFTTLEVTPSCPISSHFLVESATMLNSPQQRVRDDNESTYAFDRVNLFSDATNWTAISESLGRVDWIQLFQGKSVSENLQTLSTTCENVTIANAPPKTRKREKNSPIPRHRRILMRKRTRL